MKLNMEHTQHEWIGNWDWDLDLPNNADIHCGHLITKCM
jgi:hypothetical protein